MFYVLAIAALAVLIVVHEAGHMWVARLCGMRVEKFSVFFGPPLLRWQRNQTTYQLASIPLGGYVQIAGMNPHEQLPEDDAGSYQNKVAWKRFLTILAGPGINYLFATLIMLVVTFVWGLPSWQISVDEVVEGSPAAEAGLRAGDGIRAIDGAAVRNVDDVVARVTGCKGQALTFGLERAGKDVLVRVIPRRTDGAYRIGIRFGKRLGFAPLGIVAALGLSFSYAAALSVKVVEMLGKLVTRQVSTKQVGGPIEIVHQLKTSFESGPAMALLFLAMLNVYLGLFNLLPLPALDGGRLVFLGVEILTRRRVSQRVEALVHAVGFVLLLGLFALVTYADIKRRLFGG